MVATNTFLTLGPFTGGLVKALPAETVPADTLTDGENIEIGLGGVAKTRSGAAKYISAAIGSDPTITAVGKAIFSSASSSVFCIANAIFYEDVSGTWTDRTGGVSISTADDDTWSWVNANGDLYATSNSLSDNPIKWAAAAGNIASANLDSRFTNAKWCEWWDNRLWYGHTNANEERVWFSNLLTPETIGATSFLNFGVAVTGLKGLRTGLTVHSEDGIYLVQYNQDLSVYVQQQRADKGTVAGRSIVVNGQGQMFFIRKDGIYQWDIDSPIATEASATPRKISLPLDGAGYWDNLNGARLHQAWAVNYEDRNQIWFGLPYGTSQTDLNHILVYDYAQQIFYPPYTGTTRNCGAFFDGNPHLGGYDDGLVYIHDSGTADNGTAIDAWFETAAAPAADPSVEVRWLFALISHDVTGDFKVSLTQKADSIVTQTDSFAVGGNFDAIETAFTIGTSAIAGDSLLRQAQVNLKGYSDSVQLKFRNANANERFGIRFIKVPYRPIGVLSQSSPGVR